MWAARLATDFTTFLVLRPEAKGRGGPRATHGPETTRYLAKEGGPPITAFQENVWGYTSRSRDFLEDAGCAHDTNYGPEPTS